ncbi:MAG: ATP-binding protein [Clostridia bacterium]|nr:ATP-binding protein [Clostridia bacterium]
MGKVNRGDIDNNDNGIDPRKSANDAANQDLQANIEECYRLRDAIKAQRAKDSKNMTQEQKMELRKLYNKLLRTAKKVVDQAQDEATIKLFKGLMDTASSRAKEYGSAIVGEAPKTRMEDIKGLDNVKELVTSFLFMLKHPDVVKYYNIEGGCNMLMYGAPGTGKSMFAEAVANEMGLPIFKVTPADIFKPYVGESEASIRELFAELDTCDEGAVLFIDECESIFSARKQDTQDYKAGVTTELLQAMNGFGVDRRRIITIAATNCPEQIDPAYLRYKRFSHIVHVTPPDETAIEAIVRGKLRHTKKGEMAEEPHKRPLKLADDVSIRYIVDQLMAREEIVNGVPSYYYTPADVNGIVEEACRLALVQVERNNTGETIPLTREMFDKAFKKVPPSVSRAKFDELDSFRKED